MTTAPDTAGIPEANHGNSSEVKPRRVIRAEKVCMEFAVRTSPFGKPKINRVIQDIDLTIETNQIVGILGDSGIGKTTFAKIFAGLLKPTSGNVYLDDSPLYSGNGGTLAETRKIVRFIFQNANAALNPRMRIYSILEEPLQVHTTLSRLERNLRIEHVAREVELPLTLLDKYPRALSGGEKRRVGIARALMSRPSFIIADEPTAGLDAELREGFLQLFRTLRDAESIGVLLISHDLHAVATVCDHVVQMGNGKLM